MSRDYAKRSSSRKKYKKSYLVIWIVLLLAFTMFVTALVFIKKHSPHKNSLEQKITETKQAISRSIKAVKFDFYNTSTKTRNQELKNRYLLEIAIVNDFAAADHLKAKLTLLGFTVNIAPILKQGVQKYHINVGPYADKDDATVAQKRLKRNKISSRLKKRK